jgi:hypothetical protein
MDELAEILGEKLQLAQNFAEGSEKHRNNQD